MCTVDFKRRCKLLSFCLLYLLFCYCKYACDLRFMVPMQKGSVLHLSTKFQVDSLLGVVLQSVRRKASSSISVPNLKRIAQFVQKLLKGSQNLEIRSRDPGHAHFVSFYDPYTGRSVLFDCTKFQADSSFCSKVIRGSQNFTIGSRDPGHAHLGIVLWSARRRGPSSMSVPNLKQIALFVQKL